MTDPIIDPTRVVTWNPGLNAIGGIPTRNTIFETLTPSGGDDTSAIQTAVNNCPANQVILLGPGDFQVNSGPITIYSDPNLSVNKSNITIRGSGSGSQGNAGNTRIFQPITGNTNAIFFFGTAGFGSTYYTAPQDVTVDGYKGDTSVTVSSGSGFVVGQLVTIVQQFDSSVSFVTSRATPPNLFCLSDMPMGQVLEISGISGNIISFTTPLHFDYPLAQSPQLYQTWPGFGAINTIPLTMCGIENMYLNGGSGGSGQIVFARTKYCWMQNIQADFFSGSALDLQASFRCVIRDSYVHSAQNINPGGGAYATSISWYGADNLQENNISWNVNKVEVARSSGGGNVWGYNYYQDGWGEGYPTQGEVGLNASHYPTPHMELFEGNECWDADSDVVFGNSVYITFFRNSIIGHHLCAWPLPINETQTIRFACGNGTADWGFNFVANVLGNTILGPQTSEMYLADSSTACDFTVYNTFNIGRGDEMGNCGYLQPIQSDTLATVFIHCNYDSVTGTQIFDPSNNNHTPPNSLYLSSAPSFFGANTWPWVTPDTAPIGLAILPAKVRFQLLKPQPLIDLGGLA